MSKTFRPFRPNRPAGGWPPYVVIVIVIAALGVTGPPVEIALLVAMLILGLLVLAPQGKTA